GGGVLDPSGAVIGNAQVAVSSSESGYEMNAATNAEGLWRVFGAAAGRLKIRIDSPGFKGMVQDVIYDASRPGPFNTVLQVGSVSETVEVSAVAVGTNDDTNYDYEKEQRKAKKQAQAAQNTPSSNMQNLQRRETGH